MNKEKIKIITDVLTTLGSFSKHDIQLFCNELSLKNVIKDEVLLNNGDISNTLLFILSGAIELLKFNEDGERNTIDLFIEKDWVLNSYSFISQKPSDSLLIACENCEVFEITLPSIHRLITASPAFFQFFKLFENLNHRLHFFDEAMSPDEKYLYLLNHRPVLIQKFPQKVIASYLKITPETLSRVRARFSKIS